MKLPNFYQDSELCRVNSGHGNSPHESSYSPAPRFVTAAERRIINLYADGHLTLGQCDAQLAALPDPFGFESIRGPK